MTKNPLLQDEFTRMIRQLLSNIEPKLGKEFILHFKRMQQWIVNNDISLGEFIELDGRLKYVGICGLFCLHYQLYRADDKRFSDLFGTFTKK